MREMFKDIVTFVIVTTLLLVTHHLHDGIGEEGGE